MRTIEKKMVAAVAACRDWSENNTSVWENSGKMWVSLFGNLIACKDLKTGVFSYSCAGWHTVTTGSRLRALGCDCRMVRGRLVDGAGVEIPSRLA